MQSVGYGDGGWGDLYEALSDEDLTSYALYVEQGSKDKNKNKHEVPHLSIEPQLKAYAKFGDIVCESLKGLMTEMNPHVISAEEFKARVDELSSHLLHRYGRNPSDTDLVFVMERGIKSNLWMFMLIVRSMEKTTTKAEWRNLMARIYVATTSKRMRTRTSDVVPPPTKKQRRSVYIFTDDCVYSGLQLRNIAKRALLTLVNEASMNKTIENIEQEVHVCPPFSTAHGLSLVLQGESRIPGVVVSSWVSRMIGHDAHQMARTLFEMDTAICVRTKNHMIVKSLFAILGVVSYDIMNDDRHDVLHTVFSSGKLVVNAHVTGSAVLFQHKVADEVSIPTRWFLLGPTLRARLEKSCISAGCDVSHMRYDIGVCGLSDIYKGVSKMQSDDYRLLESDDWLNSQVGENLVVSEDKLMPILRNKGKVFKGVRLDEMPTFAPLIDPISACGRVFSETHDLARDGDPVHMQRVEDQMYDDAQCIESRYKKVLKDRLDALVAEKKAGNLADCIMLTR